MQRSELPTPTAPHQWTEWTSQVPPRPVPSRAALNGVALGPKGTLLVPVLWHLYLHGRMRTHRETPGQARQRKASFSMERTLKRPISARLRLNGPSISTGAHHGNLAAQRGQHARPMGPAACLSATWASGRRRAKACLSTKCGSTHGGACCVWHWVRSDTWDSMSHLASLGGPAKITPAAFIALPDDDSCRQGSADGRHGTGVSPPTVAQTNTCAAATHQSRVYSWRRWPAAALRCEREIAWGASPAQPSPVGVQWEGSGGRRGGV